MYINSLTVFVWFAWYVVESKCDHVEFSIMSASCLVLMYISL